MLLPLLALIIIPTAYALAPSAPVNLIATNSSSTSINLTWDPPLDLGGDNGTHFISGYDVQRTLLEFQNFTSITILNGSSTTHIDTGLLSGTSYNYQVLAINVDGTSGPSSNSSATTNVIPPVE